MTIYDINGKCSLAIDALVTAKSIKQRLSLAYRAGLVWIQAEDLPDDIRPDYELIHQRLNSSPPNIANNEGTTEPTLRAMSDEDAEEIARLIVTFSRDVEQEAARQQYRAR
jgi:hypothetical protein